MTPTPQPPVTIPQTGDSMNVMLLFALALCSALPPKHHISTRHASLTARFVACLFFVYADLRQKYCPARRFSD